MKYKKIRVYVGDELLNEYLLTLENDNVLKYTDESSTNTLEINIENVILTRNNKEFLLIIDSEKTEAYYKLKELNYELDIPINYFDKFEEDNKLVIAYQLETNDKEIKLILE